MTLAKKVTPTPALPGSSQSAAPHRWGREKDNLHLVVRAAVSGVDARRGREPRAVTALFCSRTGSAQEVVYQP
jgi:hypothetical protein